MLQNTKKLWTGKTARQELVLHAVTSGSVHGVTAAEAIEIALDGTDKCPPGSVGYAKLDWFKSASWTAQDRLVSEVRRALKRDDRLMGRRVTR